MANAEQPPADKKQKPATETWNRFMVTVPSTTKTVELKAHLDQMHTKHPKAVNLDRGVGHPTAPPSADAMKQPAAATRKSRGCPTNQEKVAVALTFLRQSFPRSHTVLVRPGGSDEGRKSMTAMRTSLGLDSIEDICIEGIRKNTDRSSVYYKTQPLFSGHFLEVGAPAAPAATGTPLPPPASAPWSIIRTPEASFHYKGTPAEQGSDPKGLKGTKGRGGGGRRAPHAGLGIKPPSFKAGGGGGGGGVGGWEGGKSAPRGGGKAKKAPPGFILIIEHHVDPLASHLDGASGASSASTLSAVNSPPSIGAQVQMQGGGQHGMLDAGMLGDVTAAHQSANGIGNNMGAMLGNSMGGMLNQQLGNFSSMSANNNALNALGANGVNIGSQEVNSMGMGQINGGQDEQAAVKEARASDTSCASTCSVVSSPNGSEAQDGAAAMGGLPLIGPTSPGFEGWHHEQVEEGTEDLWSEPDEEQRLLDGSVPSPDDVEAGVTQALAQSRQDPGSTQARQFYAALQDAVRQFQSATAATGIVVCSTTIVVVHRNVYVLDVPDRTSRRAGTTDAPRRPYLEIDGAVHEGSTNSTLSLPPAETLLFPNFLGVLTCLLVALVFILGVCIALFRRWQSQRVGKAKRDADMEEGSAGENIVVVGSPTELGANQLVRRNRRLREQRFGRQVLDPILAQQSGSSDADTDLAHSQQSWGNGQTICTSLPSKERWTCILNSVLDADKRREATILSNVLGSKRDKTFLPVEDANYLHPSGLKASVDRNNSSGYVLRDRDDRIFVHQEEVVGVLHRLYWKNERCSAQMLRKHVSNRYCNIKPDFVDDFLRVRAFYCELHAQAPPRAGLSLWDRPLSFAPLRELNLDDVGLDTGATERLAGVLKDNSVSLKNLARLSVKNNFIRVNGLLELWDLFVSTRQSGFAHDWSGNALDPGGKEAGLLSAQSTLQNPQLILNDEEDVSGGTREGWVQVNVRPGLSFLFRCTEVACLPAGAPSQTTQDRDECPQAHEEGLEYGVNAADIAADNMAATFAAKAADQQHPVTQALSELEVLLERSDEGILMLGLNDGDVSEGDAERVGQMVLHRLQKAQSTARGRRWTVENVAKDGGSMSCLQGINASQTSFALQMLLQTRNEGQPASASADDSRDAMRSPPDTTPAVHRPRTSVSMFDAARKGEVEEVRGWLKQGVDVNAADGYGSTALHFAARWGHSTTAEVLLAAKADIEARDNADGYTALHWAANRVDSTTAGVLLVAKADVKACDQGGETALHRAANRGHSTTVEVLLAAGADVKARNNAGKTASDVARNEEVKAVLDAGTRDSECADGRVMAKKESIGAQKKGETNRRVEETQVLHVDTVNDGTRGVLRRQHTAMDEQKESAMRDAARDGKVEEVRGLLEQGVDVNAADGGGRTALHYAANRGHSTTVEVLLAAKADVKACDEDGWTALHFAAWNGHSTTAGVLLVAGADVKAQRKYGRTALHFAALNSHSTTVEVLLSAGADVKARDNAGKTAFDVAGNEEVKAVLDAGTRDSECADGRVMA